MSTERPRRVQRSRARGWRKPANTIIVTRPSRWGNPFRVGHEARDAEHAVELFAGYVEAEGLAPKIRAELAGRDLCCWCPEGSACHGDVLLAIAAGVEA